MKLALVALSGAALLIPSAAPAAELEKPGLTLRTAQRIAFSPVEVFFVAELVGGHEIEEFYCPEVVWEWGDGSRSINQSDCAPFTASDQLQRLFTARHVYRHSGTHRVRLILQKADRAIAIASVRLMVRSRFGN